MTTEPDHPYPHRLVDPVTWTTTRLSWQALGEHVLSAARYAATGRIGLRRTAGGIGTPPFPTEDGERVVRIDGLDLVVTTGAVERREPITTLRAAGAAAGIEPGAALDVYTPTTPLDLDAPLPVDPEAAQALAAFYAVVDDALARLLDELASHEPASVQLWPEHFDLATTVDEVNLGGSPGDDAHPHPYLYVGPWTTRRGAFWNEPFGASRPVAPGTNVDDVLAYFREGLRHAATDPVAR